MSPQRKTTPATEPDASERPSGSHPDIEQLRERIERERDLVERLAASGATGRPGGRALLDEVRTRYENAVHAVCDQLADTLEESVDQNERLRKRNHKLESQNADLKYRNAKLRLELNRAMGIKSSSGGAGADNAENAAGQNETKGGENANASSDGKKKPKGKTRESGAPQRDTAAQPAPSPKPSTAKKSCRRRTPAPADAARSRR